MNKRGINPALVRIRGYGNNIIVARKTNSIHSRPILVRGNNIDHHSTLVWVANSWTDHYFATDLDFHFSFSVSSYVLYRHFTMHTLVVKQKIQKNLSCCKCLSHNELRRAGPPGLVVSPYGSRLYAETTLTSMNEHLFSNWTVTHRYDPILSATIFTQ